MSDMICKRCGLPVHEWYFGWKHSTGGNTKKKACPKAIPMHKPKAPQPEDRK